MVKRLAAGDMRHTVVIKEHKIEAGSTAYDGYGQLSASSTAWVTRGTVRAAIAQLTGQEAELARQIYPQATYSVTIDYNETLASTGGSRRAVVIGSRFLHVGGVTNPGMEDVQLELLCGEER